ncbi:MAG TPA: transposase family protein [Mycobacterium sp.]|nr:transposase family protein [Mycobacterium sp.]
MRTNLTTRALAAPFTTSQSAVDRVLHQLVPVLARALRPAPDSSHHP